MINPRNKIFLDCISNKISEADLYSISYVYIDKENIVCNVEAAEELENEEIKTISADTISQEDFLKCLNLLGNKDYKLNINNNIIMSPDGKKSYKYIQILLPLAVAIFNDGTENTELNFGDFLTKKIRSQFRIEFN